MYGNVGVEDAPRSGRPVSSTAAHIVQMVELVLKDRRITVRELAHDLEISEGSAHDILVEKLQKEKGSSRWVPHPLTDEQKTWRVQLSRMHLPRPQRDTTFLEGAITSEETWVRSHEPELKRESSEWRSDG